MESESESNSTISSDEEDYNEADESSPTSCLFCTALFATIDEAIEHLDKQHKVQLQSLQEKFQMDQYSFIKLINYIRLENITAEELLHTDHEKWNDEKYLKPVRPDEPWLFYDYEIMDRAAQPLTEQDMVKKLAEQAQLLEQASKDMSQMREDYKNLMNNMYDESKDKEKSHQKITKLAPTIDDCTDKEYFNGYANVSLHFEMLSDQVRTNSYRKALMKNSELINGKSVLDVGCGTGILSIFASQAGAASVFGIDNSDIIYDAMEIINKNNINNVHLVKGRLEDTKLPVCQYDIIISEWMGYFLLYEGMLDSIIYARQHYLKPNGIILPTSCNLYILGYGNDVLYAQQVGFWSDVYGINMCHLRKRSMKQPSIDVVDPENILTESEMIASFDMMTVDMNYSNFTYKFNLICKQSGKLSAFIGYFDTRFDLPLPVTFGTSPTEKPTHWRQTIFFIDKPHEVKENEVVSGKISVSRHANARGLKVTIEAFGNKNKYTLFNL